MKTMFMDLKNDMKFSGDLRLMMDEKNVLTEFLLSDDQRPVEKQPVRIIILKRQHFMMFDKHKKFIYVLPQKRRHNLLSKSFGRHKIFIDFVFFTLETAKRKQRI